MNGATLALAALIVALLAAPSAAAQAIDDPEARGVAPPLRIHGHSIPTRDQIYEGDRAPLTGVDVASADYRPELAALGERSGPAKVDEEELRSQTLALYGATPEPRPAGAARKAAKRPKSRPVEGSPDDERAGGVALGSGIALLLLGVAAFLTSRRRRDPADGVAMSRTDEVAPQ